MHHYDADRINCIPWKPDELKDGCILASLAHAIMVAKYPFLANEHSWDGANYSVQDSEGQRGTITFLNGICVAAFRNDNSERIAWKERAEHFFQGATSEVLQIANLETLQFLMDKVDGTIRPFITTAFWGERSCFLMIQCKIYSKMGPHCFIVNCFRLNKLLNPGKSFTK